MSAPQRKLELRNLITEYFVGEKEGNFALVTKISTDKNFRRVLFRIVVVFRRVLFRIVVVFRRVLFRIVVVFRRVLFNCSVSSSFFAEYCSVSSSFFAEYCSIVPVSSSFFAEYCLSALFRIVVVFRRVFFNCSVSSSFFAEYFSIVPYRRRFYKWRNISSTKIFPDEISSDKESNIQPMRDLI